MVFSIEDAHASLFRKTGLFKIPRNRIKRYIKLMGLKDDEDFENCIVILEPRDKLIDVEKNPVPEFEIPLFIAASVEFLLGEAFPKHFKVINICKNPMCWNVSHHQTIMEKGWSYEDSPIFQKWRDFLDADGK